MWRRWLRLDLPVGLPADLDSLTAVAASAERAGFDALWIAEAAAGGPRPAGEVYALLGALAVGTRTIRLGAAPQGDEVRAPAVLAKIATGLDVVSHGRSAVGRRAVPDAGAGGRGASPPSNGSASGWPPAGWY